jgi:hypothetical protein
VAWLEALAVAVIGRPRNRRQEEKGREKRGTSRLSFAEKWEHLPLGFEVLGTAARIGTLDHEHSD